MLEAQIKNISDKLQQLVKKTNALQKENETLNTELIELKKREEDYKNEIFSLKQKVNILKAASGNMTEADQREFEKRIDKYVREIEKCIGMLSE